MRILASTRRSYTLAPSQIICALTLTFFLTSSAPAQSGRDQVPGVQNFGKVTDLFFRGGKITPGGVDRLASMGVRTIIDLRDAESPGEPEACERNGIKYFKFPMNGHETPDDKSIDRILTLLREAKAPVYVHCSAGKHRAGTVAALYRTRVQGWADERAWAEQQSYGFGVSDEHSELYAYVYGSSNESDSADTRLARSSGVDSTADTEDSDNNVASDRTVDGDDDGDKGSHKSKDKDGDKDGDKDKKSSKSHKKKKDKDRKEKGSDSEDDAANAGRNEQVSDPAKETPARENTENSSAPASKAEPVGDVASLMVNGDYIALKDAIGRGRAEGGTGDVLKVDLEWDTVRTLATWDITFSSGDEYELDARSGAFLGKKSKTPAKLALLSPLDLEGSSKMKALTFQEIMQRVESSRNQKVLEIELKRIKERDQTIYEVALVDGTTLFLDAATGEAVPGS